MSMMMSGLLICISNFTPTATEWILQRINPRRKDNSGRQKGRLARPYRVKLAEAGSETPLIESPQPFQPALKHVIGSNVTVSSHVKIVLLEIRQHHVSIEEKRLLRKGSDRGRPAKQKTCKHASTVWKH